MKKRIIAGFVALIVVVGGMIGFNMMNKDEVSVAHAGTFRDGIMLVPTSADATGVSADSDYKITFEEGAEMTLAAVKAQLTVMPELAYEIKEEGQSFLLKLKETPSKNSLLKMMIGQTSWLFQIQSDFSLIGSLPRDMSTGVPMNSGIELYFTHTGAEVEDYFTIEPEVDGTFERYGSTVVFVPKGLEPMTVYTVTLKEGLTLKGSDEALSEPLIVSFETGYDEEGVYEEPKGYFNYNRIINDYALDQPLYVPMRFSINDQKDAPSMIDNTLYSFNGGEDAISAIKAFLDGPTWRSYNQSTTLTEVKGLNKVIEFEQPIIDMQGYEMTVDIPVTLDPGFYLLQSEWEDIGYQTFLQVTDLGYFWFKDDQNDYYWLNDLSIGQPSEGAYYVEEPSFKADENGLLTLPKSNEDGVVIRLLTDGNHEVLHYSFEADAYYERYGYSNSSDGYWRYLQTDRNLYKPKDQVEVFGFLQNRDDGTFPEEVTLEIDQQRWYFYSFWPGTDAAVPLVSETVQLNNGFFEGTLELPNLEQGGYQIQVVSGDEVLGTQYIEVENYVKPDYKMSVEADKEAIFYNETVNYHVTTSFFEGTPVSDVQVRYDVYGVSNDQGLLTSDREGKVTIPYTPGYQSDRDTEVWAGFNAYATMPESGEIYGNANTRIFLNNIFVAVTSVEKEGTGQIDVQVNKIVLERLNDGTAKDYNDYLSDPVEGQSINGIVYRNEWVKSDAGDVYDYINKITRKRYNYDMVKTDYKSVSLTTDQEGHGTLMLDLPEEENVHYTLELLTKDSDDHLIKKTSYFGNNDRYYYPDESYVSLKLDKDAYHVGESIHASILRGEKIEEGKKFLYIFASRGVKELYWSEVAILTTAFEQAFVPNIEVSAVVFNGQNYVRVYDVSARVVQEDYRIELNLEVDQETYKPGDEVTLKIKAVDQQGNPVTDGVVNLSVVDEALFALRDQNIRLLSQLYARVNGGVSGYVGSHDNSNRDSMSFYGRGMSDGGTMKMEEATMDMEMPAQTATMVVGAGTDTVVRSAFKDTALFLTTNLDNEGNGAVTFKLPDNVTSWRLTGACLSPALQGGSQIEEVKVTLPFFINTNVNRTYLVGDQPYVGVAGYGNELSGDETIEYTVLCEAMDYTVTASGKAFEKVNLPLFEMTEGTYKIQVLATAGELTDGYEETIEVVRTYQEKRVADTYKAEIGLGINTSDFGLTTLTFSDQSKGMYVPTLYRLFYSGGKRVDQQYISWLSGSILNEKFDLGRQKDEVNIGDYMTDEGGIALLPYSEADLAVTAKLGAYVKDENQRNRIKGFLYQWYYSGTLDQRSLALYGLAKMGEPVLLELNQWQMVENLTSEDWLWLALGYASLGDTYMAGVIYEDNLESDMELFEGRARYVGVSGEDAQYEMTSQLLPLLAVTAPEVSQDALAYLNSRYSKVYLANCDVFDYVSYQLAHVTSEEPSLTYTYDGTSYRVDFTGWYGRSVTLPSAKMTDFMVEEVSSDVLITADYNAIGKQSGEVDNTISISRKYLDYDTGEEKGNFKSGDIVKIVIDWEIMGTAIDHSYTITDYAPSGLVPLKNTWRLGVDDGHYWYRQIDGQKVNFGVYKDSGNYKPMVYYARVVSPGTFKADQAMIQGNSVLDSYNLSETDVIVIQP